jgi:hypothetical protein
MCEEGGREPQGLHCSLFSFYARPFFFQSNILCGATPEEDLLWDWLSDTLVGPFRKREELLCGEAQKTVCSSLK